MMRGDPTLAGFQPNAELTDAAGLGIRLLAGGTPPGLPHNLALRGRPIRALDEAAHRALRARLA